MKKTLISVAVVIALYFGYMALRDMPQETQAQAMDVSTRPAAKPTRTPEPTATIGYAATSDAYRDEALTAVADSQNAIATANKAMEINAATTSEYEARELAKTQMVHDEIMAKEASYQESIRATGTAFPTAIAIIGTQQKIDTAKLTLQAGQLTATKEAPTQYAAMVNAKNAEKYGWMNYIALLIVALVFCGFFGVLTAWIIRNPILPKSQPASEKEAWLKDKDGKIETPVYVEKQDGNVKRYVVPCSPEQLTELSELAVNGEKTLGINRLENNSRTLRRSVLYQLREFLTLNTFAVDAGAGQIALNDRGVAFLTAWFDDHKMPDEYSFAGGEQEPETVTETEVVDE